MAAQGAIIIGHHFPFFLIFINSLPSLLWVTDIIPPYEVYMGYIVLVVYVIISPGTKYIGDIWFLPFL